MTDNLVSTKLKTTENKLLDFQEYFVELKSEPDLSDVIYLNSEDADITIEVSKAIEKAESEKLRQQLQQQVADLTDKQKQS